MRINPQKIEQFYDSVGQLYIDTKCSSKFFVPDAIESYLDSIPDGYCVGDFGCGPGEEVKNHGERLRFHGFDLSQEFLKLYASRVKNSVCFAGNMCSLPVSDDFFDAGLCLFSLIHLSAEDGSMALTEIHRVLKPGARVMIAIPAGNNDIRSGIHREFQGVSGLQPIDFFLWHPDSFRNELEHIGFTFERFTIEPLAPERGHYIRAIAIKNNEKQ